MTTDAIIVTGLFKNQKETLAAVEKIQKQGWIVTEMEGQVVVRFIKKRKETFIPGYDVVFSSPEKGVVNKVNGALRPADQIQFKARQLSLKDLPAYCSSRYNTVVLPDVDGSGFLVYVLAATTEPGKLMIGGHYRLTVSADGSKIERTDRLFKSCMTLEEGKDQEGEVAAHVTTHVVSPTPLEVHVFLNLLHGRPIYVLTTDGIIWSVFQGVITKESSMDEMKKKQP